MFKYKIKRNPMVDLSKSNNTNANSFSVAASLTLEFTFILMFVQNFECISSHYRNTCLKRLKRPYKEMSFTNIDQFFIINFM